MRKAFFVLMLVLLSAGGLVSETVFEKADRLFEAKQYKEGLNLMQAAVHDYTSHTDLGKVYWRLAQFQLAIGDELVHISGTRKKLIDWFTEGEKMATKAIELTPSNPWGYYYRAAHSGRLGQMKGVFDALARTQSIRDDLSLALEYNDKHAPSYYVLGALYASVPEFISFGNTDYAVSLGRKAIDTGKADDSSYPFYLKLAISLSKRNKSVQGRNTCIKKAAARFGRMDGVMENHFFYEGVCDLHRKFPYASDGVAQLSDKEEAIVILDWLIKKYKGLTRLSPVDQYDLKEAEALLAELR